MNHYIDLRSDTVTQPGPAMRKAMAEAEVGDDVFGEDPTVNRLQETVASLLGKPSALFVPTGVMANQLALKCQCQPGDEVIVEQTSHIFNYETAAPAVLSNIQLFPVRGERGILRASHIAPAIRPTAYYLPRTSLVCLENTHNMAGGIVYPLDEIRQICSFARAVGVKLHLDGARIWNAWVATGIHPKEFAQYFDSVSVCFSKGLGAPVGSAVVGTEEFVAKARKFRKMFGGGMRQAGIIAAGALYALEHNVERLKEDHEKAKQFAEAIVGIPGVTVDPHRVETNIVIIDIEKTGRTSADILSALRGKQVLLTEAGMGAVRAVFHMDVSSREIHHAVDVFQSVFS